MTGGKERRAARGDPHPWVIVVDDMTVEKAQEVGKAMGACGVTGVFLAGTQAQNLQRYAAWVRDQKEKGEQGA